MEGFCFRKIHLLPKELIFALGAKDFVFEIYFNLKIKNWNPYTLCNTLIFQICWISR